MSESTFAVPAELAPRAGLATRLARRALLSALGQLREGALRLEEAGHTRVFGAARGAAAPATRLRVHDPRFYRRVALGGEIGGIESYADGDWDCDDPVALARLLIRNQSVQAGLSAGLARLADAARRLRHALRRNSPSGSRRNIAAHYDVGNDFYELFLDPTLTYSAGIFEREDATLEEASRAKYERLCRKLALREGDHVLEIGTGWGGFALHAAGRHGCFVTTTTISRAQYELARERISAAGLAGRVTLLLEDYRDLRGRYDKLVSIEMIEAVGHAFHEDYFRACASLLAPDGRMALQAISVPDRDYESHRRRVDFIKHHVFPGGCLVSVERIASVCARTGDLQLVHLEDLTPHYAETLLRWRTALHQSWEAARARGYGESFLRLWEFYLAYCEAGFRERQVGSVQALLARSGSRHAPVLGALPACSV
jgi:cyclopropane-fatty-acyl-phospholipid synthase